MTISVSINKTLRIDNKSYSESRTIAAVAELQRNPSLPSAKIGQLTTRTNNTDGTLTMNAGHGIVTANKIGLFWAGGARYNVTVGTVATNSVPISGGAGDVLPTNMTMITAMVEQIVEFRVDGDDLVAIMASSAAQFVAWFSDDTNAEMTGGTAKCPYAGQAVDIWNSQKGTTNPFATLTLTRAHVSHGDSTGAKEILVGAAFN